MNRPSLLPTGLAGHIVDLYKLASFRFRNPHSYTKFRFLNAVRRRVRGEVLIEAGTYRGVTTRRCARVFDRVITIELDPLLAASARHYLRRYGNVTTIQGDALREIQPIMAGIDSDRVILFLDGHFSGGDTAKGETPEPALEELAVLARYRDKISAIVIDDFREFGHRGWPKKSQLLAAAENLFEAHGFELSVHIDQLAIVRTT